jgi:hypothetical protein
MVRTTDGEIPHWTLIHLPQCTMEGATGEEIKPTTVGDRGNEPDEFFDTVADILIDLGSMGLRRKFKDMAMRGREGENQVCIFDLGNSTAWVTEYI